MLFLLFAIPVCLLPLSAYLLALAGLNHRRPPALFSGAWDFAYLLLGLIGFLILVGPVLLTGSQESWRRYWLHHDQAPVGWWVVALCYFVGLVVILAILLNRRRRLTVVYNVAPATIGEALAIVLARFGRHRVAGPAHFLVRKEPIEQLAVELDTLAGFRFAMLAWDQVTRLERAEIESALHVELARLDAAEPVSRADSGLVNWLLTAAVSFAIIAIFSLGLLIYLVAGALGR